MYIEISENEETDKIVKIVIQIRDLYIEKE